MTRTPANLVFARAAQDLGVTGDPGRIRTYGGRYCFVRTWQGMTPKGLEEEVMARFPKKYHCFPIANGAGSWWRIKKVIGKD
jgi:hypothetical protein